MKYTKPKLKRNFKKLPPITTNFAPPPVEKRLAKGNKQLDAGWEKLRQSINKDVEYGE